MINKKNIIPWYEAVRVKRKAEEGVGMLAEDLTIAGAFLTLDLGLVKQAKENGLKVGKKTFYIIHTRTE